MRAEDDGGGEEGEGAERVGGEDLHSDICGFDSAEIYGGGAGDGLFWLIIGCHLRLVRDPVFYCTSVRDQFLLPSVIRHEVLSSTLVG